MPKKHVRWSGAALRMTPLKTRVLSAIVALVVLILIYYWTETKGLIGFCSAVAFGCLLEYTRLMFKIHEGTRHLKLFFILICASVFVATLRGDSAAFGAMVLGGLTFLMMVLMTVQRAEDLHEAIQIQGIGVIGLLYCGLIPALVVRLLFLEHGSTWLFCLMAIVFSGDTMAYLVGRAIGRKKLLEAVSPKKTVEGAIGGLIGSGLAGYTLTYALADVPIWILVATGVVTGVFAQIGDLFESLLKRVADVKDSGNIMPGHGGVLDRVDGIYFAAPIYFILVRFLS